MSHWKYVWKVTCTIGNKWPLAWRLQCGSQQWKCSFVTDIQQGSCFIGCQGLFCHGNVKWLGANLPLAEYFVSDDFIFFCKRLPFGTLLCTVLANCKNWRTASEMYCGLDWHCSHIPFLYQADNGSMFYTLTYMHFNAYLAKEIMWVKNVKSCSKNDTCNTECDTCSTECDTCSTDCDTCSTEYTHSYSL
jgi:hypothetical protein